ncbi:MAG: oligopeptide transport system ATP-binding protein [Verrucomicrobiales bacterium]|jgi:oligopeptide transport system ATP-binding protein
MSDEPKRLLEVRDLKMHFPVKGGVFLRPVGVCKAVDGVSLHINEGETLGLVGESGCGKSTLGKCVVNLLKPTAGQVVIDGVDIANQKTDLGSYRKAHPREFFAFAAVAILLGVAGFVYGPGGFMLRLILGVVGTILPAGLGFLRARRLQQMPLRRELQMIFQDPAESLNSRLNVGSILEEPFLIHRIGRRRERRKAVQQLLEKVGMNESAIHRFPFEFSGGQRQRIGIARSIALNPNLIVCDEPVSALDVSVQSQVLNLMMDLQSELGLSYLFIAHDLAIVRHISDRIAVMYLGKIVELADADAIYENPQHAYTKALIEAIPVPDPTVKRKHKPLPGDVPSPINPPAGCAFGHRVGHPNWKHSIEVDLTMKEISPGHWVQPCPCCTEHG